MMHGDSLILNNPSPYPLPPAPIISFGKTTLKLASRDTFFHIVSPATIFWLNDQDTTIGYHNSLSKHLDGLRLWHGDGFNRDQERSLLEVGKRSNYDFVRSPRIIQRTWVSGRCVRVTYRRRHYWCRRESPYTGVLQYDISCVHCVVLVVVQLYSIIQYIKRRFSHHHHPFQQ